MTERPTIKMVHIKNVLGLEEFMLDDAGTLVHIRGKNGTGKTSIKKAIQSALRGKVSVDMIREDAEKGETTVIFHDGVQLVRRITEKGTTITAKDVHGVNIPSPAKYLAQYFNTTSFDPIDFLDQGADKRVELLSEVSGMEVTQAMLSEALEGCEVAVLSRREVETMQGLDMPHIQVSLSESGIEQIKQAVKDVVKMRELTGRARKERAASVKRLKDSLPEEGLEDLPLDEINARMQVATDRVEQLGNDEAMEMADATRSVQNNVAKQENEIRECIDGYERQIAELRVKVAGANEEFSLLNQSVATKIQEEKAAITTKYSEERLTRRHELESLQEKKSVAGERANTRKIMQDEMQEEQALAAKWNKMQDGIENLKDLRTQLLANINLPGVDIHDEGDLTVDGIKWEQVNLAKRVLTSVRAAILRGESVVMVDRFESCDAQTKQALCDAAEMYGVQLWTFAVSEDDHLEVETEPLF